MRAEAMSRKLASGDSRSFWQSVSASGGGTVRPDRIDGAVGETDVAALWANKFSSVLNSVHDEPMIKEFYKTYDATTDTPMPSVTVEEIRKITKKLKTGKAIGLDGIPNDFYINCSVNILVFLSIMCNACIIHEYLPESVTEGRIIPLLKGKLLDISSSDSYRPITIPSSFSKVIENVLFNRIKEDLNCEDNQFGYKDHSATDMCIFTLKSTVDYYHSLSTPVFACYVDVKAAFDRIS